MLDKIFQPKDIEEKFTQKWDESQAFQAQPNSDKPPYTIMMPPPNVTGSLHIGHALNQTLQDVLIRHKRHKGFDALWQPGTDHAGIATQMVVERQLAAKGISRHDLGREKFLEKIWEWKQESGSTIVNQLKHLGTSQDWSRERFTMDEGLSQAVIKVFVDLHEKGLIYKDKRLVNWDPKLQTAISDIEVVHKDINGHLYHVKYPYQDGSGHIEIATTRPETILADGAIAVHPDDEKYKDVVGKYVIVPICNRVIPIIADEYVKSDFGSGAVKITAAHDYNDFDVYSRHKDSIDIPLINLMNPDGTMNENVPADYIDLDRDDARKKIIADLEEGGYLVKIEPHAHQVPYGDRSGVVIEPYLTDQWYVDAKTMAQPVIEAVKTDETIFVPKNWENTFFEWMNNIQPWCISRQLWWGHQIPAWYDEEGNIFVAEDEQAAIDQAAQKTGKDQADISLTRDQDVLDTWFSSALWPFSTLGWPNNTPNNTSANDDSAQQMLSRYYPGSVLVTGFDIIFFWVARMMMMGMHIMDDVPFKTVYMHALVRDEHGQKMSKSKGNVMDPLDIIEKFGADALRFTLTAMAAQGRDIKLSESRIEGYRNFSTKLWNAARYCQMNDCYPQPDFDPKAAQISPNQWIIAQTAQMQLDYENALDSFRFNDAANILYHFIWGTFCDWYLEFTKPIMNNNDTPEHDKSEIRATTGWVLDQILIMLNPIMPFITEELFESMGRDFVKAGQQRPLLAQATLGAPLDLTSNSAFNDAAADMQWVITAISDIRSVRSDMNVPAGARIHLQVKDASDNTKRRLQSCDAILKQMARLADITISEQAVPKGALQTVIGEATFILPIADIIDIESEKKRLEKEISKLSQNIEKLDQKLANEKFIANAPEAVIAEQKSRKQEAQSIIDKLSKALKLIEEAA